MSGLLFGFLNVNKSAGMTAHDVVGAVRRIARIKQVGHAGTLDPMALGVLPVAVGKACRLIRFLPGKKTYLAGIRLGLSTTTDDIEGTTLSESTALPTEADLIARLQEFAGAQKQIPPIYSAIHVGGKRLYQLARQGETAETVDIPVRDVFIESIEAISYQAPILTVRVVCSAGTYIRSIARDLGDKFNCGGCLDSLVREQAGPFHLTGAHNLAEIKTLAEQSQLPSLIIKPESVVPLPRLSLSADQARQIRLGQSLTMDKAELQAPPETNSPVLWSPQQEHLLVMYEGSLLAVCRQSAKDNSDVIEIKPEVVLSHGE